MEEQFYVGLCISQGTFDWLWNEIQLRPKAKVSVYFHTVPILASIEASMWHEVHHNAIRLEPEGRLQILDAMFHVTDPKTTEEDVTDYQETRTKAADVDLVGASFMDRMEYKFENATERIWLKRIFIAVAAIGVFLFFKLS